MEKDYRNLTQEELLIKIKELEKEVKKLNNQIIKDDRYGLNWIDCPEAFEEESENKIPILEEVKDKAISNDDGKPTHILIEGDNYHALTCLNYTHKGKIDVIYIDPPYNIGNSDFTYKDKNFLMEYPNGKPIKKDDPLRHSSWLSFINKRLQLAKDLLSDRGVIFISIDDNEQANLKLISDRIFGEKNFITQFIRKGSGGRQDSKHYAIIHEYILCYAKNINKYTSNKEKKEKDKFPYFDEEKKLRYKTQLLRKWGENSRQIDRPNLYYPIISPDGKEYFPMLSDKEKGCWRWGKDTMNREIMNGRVEFKKQKGKYVAYEKIFDEEGDEQQTKLYSTIIEDVSNNTGATLLKEIFNDKVFSYPKPVDLIIKVIELANSNSIILDFFAGSGTTMHATMNLNEKDNGNRQCILVQQNENNICEEICYERNKRVMQGYTNSKGEEIEGLGNSLKYYKTSFVGKNSPKKATDDDRVELSYKAGYLLALSENTLEEIKKTDYYQIFENKDNATAIYFKEDLWGFDDFVKEVESIEKPTSVYIFSWDNAQGFEYNFEEIKQVQIKSIPQAILEIYKSINQ